MRTALPAIRLEKVAKIGNILTPRSKDLNDSVAIDLAEWTDSKTNQTVLRLLLIDGFSHYSVVTTVECKNSIKILENIAIGWFMRVCTPVSILHDLGGEFNNDLIMLLMSTFGMPC